MSKILLNRRYSIEELCDIDRDVSESLEDLESIGCNGTIKVFIEYFDYED